MLRADDFRKIYAYNRQVLEVFCRKLERLPWSIVSKDRGVTWHSMAGVLNHVLGVYDGWLNFVAQGASADDAAHRRAWDQLTSMAEVRAFLETLWPGVDRLLRGLTDASLRRRVRAPWQPKACTLEDALMQVTLEQAHHTGELIAMLWQEDLHPPEMTWLGTNWGLEARAAKSKRSGRRGSGRSEGRATH